MWYYANGENEVGPVSAAELKALADQGVVDSDTLVWNDGMTDWAVASDVPGLLRPAAHSSDRQASPYDEYPEHNPYAAPSGSYDGDISGKAVQLKIVGVILICMAAMTVVFTLVGNAAGPGAPPNAQGAERIGFLMGKYGFLASQLVCQALAVAGGIAMFRRKSYNLAIAGTIASYLPLCGPCLGVSIPFAIWATLLLVDPNVKAAFD